MMDLKTIERLSREAGETVAEQNMQPLVAFVDGDEGMLKCPNLGDHCPKGWKEIDRLFVDNSGFGSEGEPALTIGQFLAKVKSGLGYAVVEEGQFQIYIGVFEKIT